MKKIFVVLMLYFVLAIPAQAQQVKKKKVWDKKLWTVVILMTVANIADAETTVGAVKRGHVEANPIFGKNPGRGRIYAVKIPVNVFLVWATWKLKKVEQDNPGSTKPMWLVPPIVATSVFGGVAIRSGLLLDKPRTRALTDPVPEHLR